MDTNKVYRGNEIEKLLEKLEGGKRMLDYWGRIEKHDIFCVRTSQVPSGVNYNMASPRNGLRILERRVSDSVIEHLPVLNSPYGIVFFPFTTSSSRSEIIDLLPFDGVMYGSELYKSIKLEGPYPPENRISSDEEVRRADGTLYILGRDAVCEDLIHWCNRRNPISVGQKSACNQVKKLMEEIAPGPPKIKHHSKRLKAITERLKRKRD